MKALSTILVLLVALLHAAFLVLEMFFWDHPVGRDIFTMTEQQSRDSATLAMNQGLYNGFLVAGLLWGLIKDKFDVKVFFLGCVIVAGLFGALTAKPTIFFSQALPAILAIAAVFAARQR